MKNDLSLWLGTQQSYEAYLEASAKADARRDAAMRADDMEEEDEDAVDVSHMYKVQGSVAVINIAGSLVEGHAGWGKYYGITGYLDIRQALTLALSNAQVGSILLYTSSGGGHVAGCHETAQLIQRINKVKPVVTYNGSNMGSACTWLAASAREIFVAETANSGSIGIIMVHASREKQLKQDGINVTVIRAGAEKALATPYEDLSEKAKEVLQGKANALYDIFISHVADCRNVSTAVADSKFGQGREFFGKQAVESGLADKLGTFEDAFSRASDLANKVIKKAQGSSTVVTRNFGATNSSTVPANAGVAQAGNPDNPPIAQGSTMPTPLSDEQIAAMAAGVELNAADASTQTAMGAASKPADTTAPATPAATPGTAPAATSTTVDAMAVLQGMLATAQADLVATKAEVLAAKAETETAKAAAEAAKASLAPFVEIARASVKTMGLHFGLNAEAVAAMSADQVLSEQQRLAKMFQEKFKAGGVAATTAKEVETKKASAVPAMFAVLTQTQAK